MTNRAWRKVDHYWWTTTFCFRVLQLLLQVISLFLLQLQAFIKIEFTYPRNNFVHDRIDRRSAASEAAAVSQFLRSTLQCHVQTSSLWIGAYYNHEDLSIITNRLPHQPKKKQVGSKPPAKDEVLVVEPEPLHTFLGPIFSKESLQRTHNISV